MFKFLYIGITIIFFWNYGSDIFNSLGSFVVVLLIPYLIGYAVVMELDEHTIIGLDKLSETLDKDIVKNINGEIINLKGLKDFQITYLNKIESLFSLVVPHTDITIDEVKNTDRNISIEERMAYRSTLHGIDHYHDIPNDNRIIKLKINLKGVGYITIGILGLRINPGEDDDFSNHIIYDKKNGYHYEMIYSEREILLFNEGSDFNIINYEGNIYNELDLGDNESYTDYIIQSIYKYILLPYYKINHSELKNVYDQIKLNNELALSNKFTDATRVLDGLPVLDEDLRDTANKVEHNLFVAHQIKNLSSTIKTK